MKQLYLFTIIIFLFRNLRNFILVTLQHRKCTLFTTSTASPSTGACVLGTGTAPPRGPLLAFAVAARRVRFGNGIELLLDGAQVGHQGIQVHCVALVQRLCGKQEGVFNDFTCLMSFWICAVITLIWTLWMSCVRSHRLCCTLRSGRRSWPCLSPAWEEVSAEPSGVCHHPDSTEHTHTHQYEVHICKRHIHADIQSSTASKQPCLPARLLSHTHTDPYKHTI